MDCRRVVVTGANGFIGQHFCAHLAESGKEVIACVREQAGAFTLGNLPGAVQICRIQSLAPGQELRRVLSNVDTVVHLAGRAHHTRETAADPLLEYSKVNVLGTESVALLAAEQGVRRFIYLSSIKVNGEETNDVPFNADDPPGYSDYYGQSKWEAEERLCQIAGQSRMEWVIVRPPLVYGPGVRGNFLSLLQIVMRGVPLPLGSLQNKRTLVSVFNLSSFLGLLVDHPAAANNRFVAADDRDISSPDLVRCVAGALHRPARLVPCPLGVLRAAGKMTNKRAAVQRLCSSLIVDRQKVKNVLGWSAPTTIDWGLARTAEWFRSSRI